MLKFLLIALFVWFLALPYMNKSSDSTPSASVSHSQPDAHATLQPDISSLAQLEQANPDAISPKGDIAEIFSYGSDFTDLQRQLKLKEIRGKVIEWRLPVYEVKQSGNGYTIQTSGYAKGDVFGPKYVGTFLRLTPMGEDDRRFVERIKTGDYIKIKGVINDVTMRNLEIKPAIIFDDEKIPRQILGRTYGNYIPKYDCWQKVISKQQYCMKLARVDRLQAGNVKRIYFLALGEIVDDEGKPNGAHAYSGMVGAFVVDIQNGQVDVVASNPEMQMGSFGKAPDTWKFVKLNSRDYWGWQSATGDCMMGECYDEHIILAPYGKTIKNLAGFGGYSDDSEATSVSVALTIDSSATSAKVYPLLLDVTEEKEGSAPSKKSVKVPFDEKKWQWVYKKPQFSNQGQPDT